MKKMFCAVLCLCILASVLPVFSSSSETTANVNGWVSQNSALIEAAEDSFVDDVIKITKTVDSSEPITGKPVILATKEYVPITMYDDGPKGCVRLDLKCPSDRSWAILGIMVDDNCVAAIYPNGEIHAGIPGVKGGSSENIMTENLNFKKDTWQTFRSDFENTSYGSATDIMVNTWYTDNRKSEYHIAHIKFKSDGTENGQDYKFRGFSTVSVFYLAQTAPAESTDFEIYLGGDSTFGSYYSPSPINGWKVQETTDLEGVNYPTGSFSTVIDKERGEVLKISKNMPVNEQTQRYFSGYQKLLTKDIDPIDLGNTITDDLGWYADKAVMVDFWIKLEGREGPDKDYGSVCVFVNEKPYVFFEPDTTLRKNGSSGYGYFVDRNDDDRVLFPDGEWRRIRFTLRMDNGRVANGDFTQTNEGVWKTNPWGGQYSSLDKTVNSVSIGYKARPSTTPAEEQDLNIYIDNFRVTVDHQLTMTKNGDSYTADYTVLGIGGTPSRFNENAKVFIAAYDESGKLIEVKQAKEDFVTVNNNTPINAHGVCTGTVSIAIDASNPYISYVSAYAWDSLGGMKPIVSSAKKNVFHD